jgi:predicted aminopeptidase
VVASRAFAAALVAFPLAGCYYLQQYRGQLSILSAAKPIEEVVSQGKVTAEEAETLRYILELKRFAEERIGLKKTENFTTYFDAGNRPVSWAVSACRKDRFEPYLWLYPIVGPSRYKGFFDEGDARSERQRLENLGYDTLLSPVPAYSTLGYFRDPVYSHFLNYSRADLADLIIHELVHSTVYVAGDTAYNESLASFVASVAAEEFLIERFGEDSGPVREFRTERKDHGLTEAFVSGVFGLLDAYYRAGLATSREEAFELIRSEYAEAYKQWSRPRLGLLFRRGIDNASIMASRTYHRTAWWSRVYESCRGDWKAFFDLARRAGAGKDPFREMEKLLSEGSPLD